MGRGLDGFFASCRPSAVFKLHGGRSRTFRWRDSERETPLPIPNRAVKPLSADGTWRATSWESRSPPVLYESRPRGGFRRSGRPRRDVLPRGLARAHFLGVSFQLKECCSKIVLKSPLPLRIFPTLPGPSIPDLGVDSWTG